MSCTLPVIFIKHTNLPQLTWFLKVLHVRATLNFSLFNAFYVFPYKCLKTIKSMYSKEYISL